MRQIPPSKPAFWINAAQDTLVVNKLEILSESRRRDIVQARDATIWLIRAMTDASYPAIGKIFSRDHSTIMSAVSKAEKDRSIGELIEEILEYVESQEE